MKIHTTDIEILVKNAYYDYHLSPVDPRLSIILNSQTLSVINNRETHTVAQSLNLWL